MSALWIDWENRYIGEILASQPSPALRRLAMTVVMALATMVIEIQGVVGERKQDRDIGEVTPDNNNRSIVVKFAGIVHS